MSRKIILHCTLSPGDVLTMTAAVESLHATYPEQYVTDVRTPASEIWQHTLTYKWTQTAGSPVTLSDDSAEKPTFTAPAGPATLTFELKVKDITKDLHHHNPANAESLGDSVTITVNP